ncbi:unnamed protein product [Trichobilharzia regenti]|nr:unnamed protein product [Trichobilharzia regenti]
MTTTEITCLFPIIGLSGQKMVKVQQPYDFISKAIDFNVSRPNAPVILSVQQQQSASVSGTTQVIINGLRFTRDMLIFVGGVRVQNFTFVNETQIIMLAPPQKINGEKLIALFDSQNILISPEYVLCIFYEN